MLSSSEQKINNDTELIKKIYWMHPFSPTHLTLNEQDVLYQRQLLERKELEKQEEEERKKKASLYHPRRILRDPILHPRTKQLQNIHQLKKRSFAFLSNEMTETQKMLMIDIIPSPFILLEKSSVDNKKKVIELMIEGMKEHLNTLEQLDQIERGIPPANPPLD
jgi:hypothetical protein